MTAAADPLWGAVIPVLDAMDRLGIDHYIGGSVASSLLGAYRSTNDVDLVADVGREHAAPLAAALAPTHICDASWISGAIDRRGSFNAIHAETGFKIDVFAPEMAGFAAHAMQRRSVQVVPTLGRSVTIASAQDVVLQKLNWYRQGGETSERQWLDVLAVLKLQGPTLDRDDMRRWAAVLGVSDLLDRALAEAG